MWFFWLASAVYVVWTLVLGRRWITPLLLLHTLFFGSTWLFGRYIAQESKYAAHLTFPISIIVWAALLVGWSVAALVLATRGRQHAASRPFAWQALGAVVGLIVPATPWIVAKLSP